ncbi:hypothetical protein B0H14DRAFT_3664002, partial [Mycena olivaceomarginata]
TSLRPGVPSSVRKNVCSAGIPIPIKASNIGASHPIQRTTSRTPTMLLKSTSFFVAALAAVPLSVYAGVVDSGTSLVNVTRSVGDLSVTLVTPCVVSVLTMCHNFCDADANQSDVYHSDCYQDCQDDICDFGKAAPDLFEFPPGSGSLVNFSTFKDISRETKIAEYSLSHANSSTIHPDGIFCSGCRTAEDWARLAGRPSPKGIIAQLALSITCAAACSFLRESIVMPESDEMRFSL